MFKTKFLLIGVLTVAVVSATASAALSTTKRAQVDTLTLAYAPITDYAPIFVGLKLNYFKKENIQLKTTTTSITPASLVAPR